MDDKVDTKLVKRTVSDWLKVLVLLLDEAAVIFLVVALLWFLGIRIPLPLMIVVLLLVGALVFVIHIAVIPSFHKRPVTGSEELLGAQGKVVEPLTPVGTITVKGEYWRAESVEDDIEVDEDVEIIGRYGLTLGVRRKDQQAS